MLSRTLAPLEESNGSMGLPNERKTSNKNDKVKFETTKKNVTERPKTASSGTERSVSPKTYYRLLMTPHQINQLLNEDKEMVEAIKRIGILNWELYPKVWDDHPKSPSR